ncbi:hypothetical protein D9M68_359870 [compost metagenome]
MRGSQRRLRRIDALGTRGPGGQCGQHGVAIELQFLQGAGVVGPGVDKRAACRVGFEVGLLPPFSGFLGVRQPIAVVGLLRLECHLPGGQVGVALLHMPDFLTAPYRSIAQGGSCLGEGPSRFLREFFKRACKEGIPGQCESDTASFGCHGALSARQRGLGPCGFDPPVGRQAAFFFPHELLSCHVALANGTCRLSLPFLGILFGLAQAIGVLIGRIALQCLQPFPGGSQGKFCGVVGRHGIGFGCTGIAQCALRPVALFAGVVKCRLRLAQFARLPSGERAGIFAIPVLEMPDRLFKLTALVQLFAVFLQLVECHRYVGQQFRRHGRQRLGQCVGQAGFVRLFRQLGLAKLDQGIHQGLVAPRTDLEEALVDGTPVAAGAFKDLGAGMWLQGFAQAFPRQYNALLAGQPHVLANARRRGDGCPVDHEEPALDLRLSRHGGHAGSQRKVAGGPVRLPPAEFDPGIAYAPGKGVHQQVPGHLLAVVSVWLDAGGPQLGIEEEGQGQGQHLGLSGSVIAAQKKMAVPEPELFTVIVKKVHEPDSQGLPPVTQRLWQRRTVGERCVEQRICHDQRRAAARTVLSVEGLRSSGSPRAKRAIAGSGWISRRSRAIRWSFCSRSSAISASSTSAPGSRADLRQ